MITDTWSENDIQIGVVLFYNFCIFISINWAQARNMVWHVVIILMYNKKIKNPF